MTWRKRQAGLCAMAFAASAAAEDARATTPYSCGGFAQLGGAQLLCSHLDPKAPAQMCSFSWALTPVAGGVQVAEGSFLLVPGVANATVYQGSGFTGEASPPIVLCQAKRSQ